MLYLYTDGSSTGRANREWGWGFVIVSDDAVIAEGHGGGKSGTNNIAELEAAIQGFCWLINNEVFKPVTLVSDSRYVLNIADKSNLPKKNVELAQELQRLYAWFKAKQQWVRGHSNNKWNDRADQLAKQGKEKYAK